MSRRFTRLSLLLVLMLSSQVWAIGLGDIKLESALNEPLRAEISLLSASADELGDLTVTLASAETFARYGIDRPFFLQGLEFTVVDRGAGGSIVQVRSRVAMTEPFLTFLVEANWPSGRLLREYTVLLDPPTFSPPAAQPAPAVSAPSRSAPADSGRINRQPPAAAQPQTPPPAARPSQPARTQRTEPQSQPQAPVDNTPYATTGGGDYVVERSETLWGIASRLRPDSRLTMNQTMLAIYEANPQAFGGNINLLKAGASLRVPSADEIIRINRGDALSEVSRQNSAWSGDTGYVAPEPSTSPGLVLVPADEEPLDTGFGDETSTAEPVSREDQILDRMAELETADVSDQQSLIEIRDNELAALRQELADLRGEVYQPPVDETPDEPFVDEVDSGIEDVYAAPEDELAAEVDETAAAEAEAEAAAAAAAAEERAVRPRSSRNKSMVEKITEFATGIWGIIIGALILVAGALIWFMRRGGGDDDIGPWERLDSEDIGVGTMSATESLQAPTRDEAIVVVEEDSGVHPIADETLQVSAADDGEFGSLEDTFSSETAINLDQTDPIAEADFHMAYGLYDQAADLVNGALETDPSNLGLISKLSEIYFVWGNRNAFVDAAGRLKSAVGDAPNAEWDKIVIMGQQIAPDHALFAGAAVAGATEVVDLSFGEADDAAAGALDMDFDAGSSGEVEVIDLGTGAEQDDGVDFLFDSTGTDHAVDVNLDSTAENPTVEAELFGSDDDATAETPTIEQPLEDFDVGTTDLPSLDSTLDEAISHSGKDASATAEINLDELDLDVDGLAATEVAALDDLDSTGHLDSLSDTGINEALAEGLDFGSFEDPDATGEMRLASDETGRSPMIDAEVGQDATDVTFDQSLLDATGRTQVLGDDFTVATGADLGSALSDDDATQLAPMDDDEFDFAKTEALPADVYSGDMGSDDTAEVPAIAGTDVDLDLDDLTAALQLSEAGDTVEQPRDDATVEQPRPGGLEEGTASMATMSLEPDDVSDARTMTEVGTKLDLARAYVDMGDPAGARGILEEVLDEGDADQKQQAQQLLDSLPS